MVCSLSVNFAIRAFAVFCGSICRAWHPVGDLDSGLSHSLVPTVCICYLGSDPYMCSTGLNPRVHKPLYEVSFWLLPSLLSPWYFLFSRGFLFSHLPRKLRMLLSHSAFYFLQKFQSPGPNSMTIEEKNTSILGPQLLESGGFFSLSFGSCSFFSCPHCQLPWVCSGGWE